MVEETASQLLSCSRLARPLERQCLAKAESYELKLCMLFLDHIYLIPLLPGLRRGDHVLLRAQADQADASTRFASAWSCWHFFSPAARSCNTTYGPARNNHQPFQKIVYTWLGTDTGHLNFLTKDGSPADFKIDAGFLLDPLSSIWLLFVTGVGMLIHIYSTGYMAHEGGYYRFFGYLNLFMFSMLTLILANNYVLMFVGWEGVGLCSYLLIGFYFHRKSASDAANKAFIVNRIGDAGFILGMFFIAWLMGSLRYIDVNAAARSGHFQIGDPIITAATLLLFVGACGKSAQLPLYVWLPDAMEGPTPVSALIHAATMVTAGVYMVARSNALFVLAPTSMKTVAIVGALTAIFAASIGLVQNDIKRVLAYSTVSQLGYMFLALGVGAFAAGVFHVFTHAFFKALLFLGAGSVIHAMSGEQDMRNMGDLRERIPTTYWTMFIATLAIAGIPPFAGFFSKDEILWQAWTSESVAYHLLWFIGYATALMTAFYMFRLIYLTFCEQAADEPRGRAPHPRVACVDDDAAGRAGCDVAVRRIPRIPAEPRAAGRHSRRDQSFRSVSRAGLRERGASAGQGRAGTTRCRSQGRGAYQRN